MKFKRLKSFFSRPLCFGRRRKKEEIESVSLLSDALAIHTAMAVAIANGGQQRPQRPQRCSTGAGPKFKLIHEGDIQVCRLNHSRTLISKVLSSKFLRRWEAHHVYLGDFQMYSATCVGFMECPLSYQEILDAYTVNRWDTGQHFCIRVTIPDGSVLLKAPNAYLRDQWLHSLKWKVNLLRYKRLISKSSDPEALTKELRELVLFSLTTPIQDDVIFTVPLEMVSDILAHHFISFSDEEQENLIVALAPVLEYVQPSPEVCAFFSKHCKGQLYNNEVLDVFLPAVHRILKHNMDFGKYPHLRMFVQDYIYTLFCKDYADVVREFVESVHSPSATCPHPRVLPNLVAVVLSAVYSTFDQSDKLLVKYEEINTNFLLCFMTVMDTIAQFEDWRPNLSTLLQPIPFPKEALKNETFVLYISAVIKAFAEDQRCEVHQSILPVRKGKDGWIDIICPGGVSCFDEGHFFSHVMGRLLNCCGRRKKILLDLKESMLGPFMLLALRGDSSFIQTLAFMLEVEVLQDENEKLQIISTLESTEEGKLCYEALCQKKAKFRQMEKGGPTVLTLPTKSTDDDLARLLKSGSFGNLQSLNLAFTHVTSACAEYLVQLPALLHLNLWSTQFGDKGLHMVAEQLHNLESLNLCETPVTDDGLSSLVIMSSLRNLNLNSTRLSPTTYEKLKKLPRLEEIDVRYTDV
ncbi:C-Maf-inducing protein-like isoform X2 [Pocillopora damicornis]|uniref:C-Maf-inducing protein-like isoform X2 n=2 Tax=Pocillopora TaxID=46730 RepID=UPI000F54DFB7|nr:C-Maf-inducing protein-like isoform X2 [Pocillopora damicornis]